jgi:hypothetical protein
MCYSLLVQDKKQQPYILKCERMKKCSYLALMLRKIAAPLLIALVICQIGAAWTVFSTAIWIHKQNKQARLADKKKWEEFQLTALEFEASLVDESEIEIKGQLYDIVTSQELDGIVKITAVADRAENKMKRTLSGLQKEDSGWSEVAKQVQSFSAAVYRPAQTLFFWASNFPTDTCYIHYPEVNNSKGFPKNIDQPPTV